MLDALLDELDGDQEDAGEPQDTGVFLAPRLTTHRSPAHAAEHDHVVAVREGTPATSLDWRGLNLQDADLSELDLRDVDLTGANLARANLTGTSLFGACLRDAMLYGATFDRADLTGADLTDANLESARGDHTGLGGTTCTRTKLAEARFTAAALSEARFEHADLRGAAFDEARGIRIQLLHCDLTSASVSHSDLSEALVTGSVFDNANLRESRLTGIRGYEEASWIGTDTRDIPPLGIFMWKRFVTDQNYLAEFRTRGRGAEWAYWVWWLTSDCGRSIARWSLFTCAIIFAFAGAFSVLPVVYEGQESWLSPLYFSVVTITSLGYGDALPASPTAQALAMVEVVLGYVMLGGLLTILSNKMARRGE